MTINITLNIPDGKINEFERLVECLTQLGGKVPGKGATKAPVTPVRETKAQRMERVKAKIDKKLQNKSF